MVRPEELRSAEHDKKRTRSTWLHSSLPSSIHKAALCYSYSTGDSDPSLFAERTSTPNPWRWRIAFLPTRASAKSGRDEMEPPSGPGHSKLRCAPGPVVQVYPMLAHWPMSCVRYCCRGVPVRTSRYRRWFRTPQRKPRPPLASRERARALLTVAGVCWEAVAAPSADTQKKRAAQPHAPPNCALTLTPA
jgi:hypothetical protein